MEIPLLPDSQSNPLRGRILPDPEICRAKTITGDLAECLVTPPVYCPYAIPFGGACFCKHPQRAEIIARTLPAEKPPPTSPPAWFI